MNYVRIETPLGENFIRLQIFSLEIFFRTRRSGPHRSPVPEASASPASWMIRPCLWLSETYVIFVRFSASSDLGG